LVAIESPIRSIVLGTPTETSPRTLHRLATLKVIAGFLGLVLATLIGLYGLFLVLYQGEKGSEGDTYVNVGGKKIDADFVGVPLLLVAAAVGVVSLRALRRRGVP
jgi:hypothetical protein